MAIRAGADALGLVAAMPSGPGSISDEAIAKITAEVPPPIASFLLTSESKAEAISAHVKRTRPTAVQIVSHIDPSEAAALAILEPSIKRVQVIHVESSACLELIPAYAPFAHAFLLDSGRPGAAIPELGGTGRSHDWDISRQFVEESPLPVFLAGGLNANNIATAIRKVRPFGVDLCSSVRNAGSLAESSLLSLIAAVRSTDETNY